MAREILKNASLALATLSVCLLIAEGLTRWLFADTIVLFPRYHTEAQYGDFTLRRLRPNEVFWHQSIDGRWQFRTNTNGFRSDTDYAYEKPEGLVRVLILGDSQTQGFEVNQDETYAFVIEEELRGKGYEVQVLNTGISGFGTAEQLAFLENEGVKYDPDFIVLGFNLNDIEDNIKSGLFTLDESGSIVERKQEHLPGVWVQDLIYSLPFAQWLGENSYLYSLSFNTVWAIAKRALAKDAAEATFEYARATQTSYSAYQIDLAAALILRVGDVAKAIGAPFILVDIPNPDPEQRFIASIPGELEDAVAPRVDRYFGSGALFAQAPLEHRLHAAHGHRHISPYSHRVIGEAVARHIESVLVLGHETRETGTREDPSRTNR